MTLISCTSSNNISNNAEQPSIKAEVLSVPDYTLKSSWAALPGMPGTSNSVPLGSSKAIEKSNVDVFYIHPTTLKDKTQINQDIADEETNAWTDASVIARQASVFNHCCEIYAPRYRQAGSAARFDPESNRGGSKANLLAYKDVLNAFDFYIKNYNQGRPFIIAGHSQGSLITTWLLRDRIDSTPLQKQLVAAYAVGIDLVKGDFGRTYKSLKLCTSPEQTGCVLGWNTGTKDLDIEKYKDLIGARYLYKNKTHEGRKGVCINPLTFDINKPDAPASASKGAVPGTPGVGELKALKAGLVSAKCDRGFLIVNFDPSLDLVAIPEGSMHYHDIGLFYADIRENVAVRISHFMNK